MIIVRFFFTKNTMRKVRLLFMVLLSYMFCYAKAEISIWDSNSYTMSNNQCFIHSVNLYTIVEGEVKEEKGERNLIDGHEYVDLGLPSGKLWATMNYGASKPEDYGEYANWNSNDIISSSWGPNWITPTLADINELESCCSWTWETRNGINGYKIKGTNGNTIFLPAAGIKNIILSGVGEMVYYWTSTKYTQLEDMAYVIMATNSDVAIGSFNYAHGNLPIRPVSKKGKEISPTTETKEWVDLGLPSGLLWAKTNIGAHQEYEVGNRYSFGETQTKTYYKEDNYKWLDQTTGQYTKYVNSGKYADYKTELEREDDAATQNWGEPWHMPSLEDIEELCRYCSSRWEKVNGIYGRRFIASNGNSIFLPAGGFIYSYNQYYNELGYYMTTHVESDAKCRLLYFSSSTVTTKWINIKCEGYSVRPVTNFDPAKKHFSLIVQSIGNGYVFLRGTNIRNETKSFTINEGINAILTFTPDNGYKLKSVKVDGVNVMSSVSNNQYTINIVNDTHVEVEFEEDIKAFTVDGVNYTVESFNEKTVVVSKGNYGPVLVISPKVSYLDMSWEVASMESGALTNSPGLCAIVWNLEVAFSESITNPNLLLYVKSANYAPQSIKNVVVNNIADKITLVDAADGNSFCCPQEFTAKSISYTHHYKMGTGINESKGWETIALPFDVQKVSHQSKSEIVPFAIWKSGDSKKPFWLMQYGNSGWTDASSIKAYTPYIISMPNHKRYKEEYKLNGNVTFSAENVKIGKTENLTTSSFNGRTFVPNFSIQTDKSYYALNVNNDYVDYQGSRGDGSMFFIGLRDIHPFEAYMTTTSGARSITIADDMMTTGIHDIMEMIDEEKVVRVYNLKGQLIKIEDGKTLEQVKKTLPAGVYIINGQKLVIK